MDNTDSKIPQPSQEVLREGDIYLRSSSVGPGIITKVENDGFSFRDEISKSKLQYNSYRATKGIFMREEANKGLVVVAVGSQFELSVKKVKSRI